VNWRGREKRPPDTDRVKGGELRVRRLSRVEGDENPAGSAVVVGGGHRLREVSSAAGSSADHGSAPALNGVVEMMVPRSPQFGAVVQTKMVFMVRTVAFIRRFSGGSIPPPFAM